MTTPRRVTRSTVKNGEDTLNLPADAPEEWKMAGKVQITNSQSIPATPTGPEPAGASKEKTGKPTPNTPGTKKPKTGKKSTPKDGKKQTQSKTPRTVKGTKTTVNTPSNPGGKTSPPKKEAVVASDDSFVPDPEPKKRPRNKDPSYRPTKSSDDSDDIDIVSVKSGASTGRKSKTTTPNETKSAQQSGTAGGRVGEDDQDNGNSGTSKPTGSSEQIWKPTTPERPESFGPHDDANGTKSHCEDDSSESSSFGSVRPDSHDASRAPRMPRSANDRPTANWNTNYVSQGIVRTIEEHDSPPDSESSSDFDSEDEHGQPFILPNVLPFRRTGKNTWHNKEKFDTLRAKPPKSSILRLKSALKRAADDDTSAGEGSQRKRVKLRSPLKSPVWRRAHKTPDPLTVATDTLFQEILYRPRSLEIAHIGALFVQLQEETQRLAYKHFYYDLTPGEEQAWPLQLLKWHYKALKTQVTFLADADKIGWRQFFTKREHRMPLVMAIVANMLSKHVFNDAAYSFSLEEDRRKLAEIDEKYIHYDSFIRNKHRARVLEELIARRSFPFDHHPQLLKSTENLMRTIYDILEPLLPPHLFNPERSNKENLLTSKRSWWADGGERRLDSEEEDRATFYHEELVFDLTVLIQKAIALHLSIRLTGSNGTMIKIRPNVRKGSPFVVNGPQVMVNNTWYRMQDAAPNEELVVKMTCWPQVEACVPHGVDLEEFERHREQNGPRDPTPSSSEQDATTQFANYEGKFRAILPALPPELQSNPEAALGVPPAPGTEWDYKTAVKAAVGNRKSRRRTVRDPGDGDDFSADDVDADTNPLVQRGSYVTLYPSIAPARVYCTWDIPHRPTTPLDAAIDQLRTDTSYFYAVEDFLISRANWVSWLLYRSGIPEQWPLLVGGGIAFGAGFLASQKGVNIPTSTDLANYLTSLRDPEALRAALLNGVNGMYSTASRKWRSGVSAAAQALRHRPSSMGTTVSTVSEAGAKVLHSTLSPGGVVKASAAKAAAKSNAKIASKAAKAAAEQLLKATTSAAQKSTASVVPVVTDTGI